MAEKDPIQKRADALQGKSSSEIAAESVAQAEAALGVAQGAETKGFFDTLTDPSSIIHGLMAAGALAAGSPEGAAAIAGLDILQSPKEMKASKTAKAAGVASAGSGLDEATKELIDTREKAEAEATKLALALREDFFANPMLFSAAMKAEGRGDSEISNLLKIKPGSIDFDAYTETFAEQKRREDAIVLVTKRMEEAATPSIRKAHAKDLAKLSLPGVELKDEDFAHIYDNLGNFDISFDDLYGKLATALTAPSYAAASTAYYKGSRGSDITDIFVTRKDQDDYKHEQDEKELAAKLELDEVLTSLITTKWDVGTGKYVIVDKPSIQDAIKQMPTAEYRVMAQEKAELWGHAGTEIGQERAYYSTYAQLSGIYVKLNDDKIEADPDGHLLKPLPASWVATTSADMIRDGRAINDDAIAAKITRDVNSLRLALTDIFVIPGFGYEAAQDAAMASARAILGPSVKDPAQLIAKAAQLVTADPQKYADIASKSAQE